MLAGMDGRVKAYRVRDIYTNKVIVEGTAQQCADALGIAVSTLRSDICRNLRGITRSRRYKYEVIGWSEKHRLEADMAAMAMWDYTVHNLRVWLGLEAEDCDYPCKGCMNRVYCGHTGESCAEWQSWFNKSFNVAKLRIVEKEATNEAK